MQVQTFKSVGTSFGICQFVKLNNYLVVEHNLTVQFKTSNIIKSLKFKKKMANEVN